MDVAPRSATGRRDKEERGSKTKKRAVLSCALFLSHCGTAFLTKSYAFAKINEKQHANLKSY